MPKSSFGVLSLALLAVALCAGAAPAQTVGGTWMITASTQPQPGVDAVILLCQWTGTWQLTEVDGQVSGTVVLELDPTAMNDEDCPATMTSTLSATNNGGSIQGTIGGQGDPLGEVSFTGTATAARAAAQEPATSASGSFSVVEGDYAFNAGTWGASMAPAMPTLPTVGLVALLLLLFIGGGVLLLRRRPA